MFAVDENPRRRRHRRARRHSANRRRRHSRRNPGFARSNITRSLTSGFHMGAVKEALPLAAGALANYYLSAQLSARVPMVASGIASYASGIALAGLSGLVPKVGPKLFVGGMTYQVLRAVNQYLMPGALKLGEALSGMGAGDHDYNLMSGMGDLVTPAMLPGSHMGEFMQDDTPVENLDQLDSYDIYGK